MTDLEITKLCAEAMGLHDVSIVTGKYCESPAVEVMFSPSSPWDWYNPLHDDAHAMALVKKFQLGIFPYGDGVWDVKHYGDDGNIDAKALQEGDLNRAICECVAKIHKEKA